MKKKKTKKQLKKEEAEKVLIFKLIAVIGIALFVGIIGLNLNADTITHKFK